MNAHGTTRLAVALCLGGVLLGTVACGPTRPVTARSDTLAAVTQDAPRVRDIKQTHLAADAYFAFGSTALSEEGKAKLDALAASVPGKQEPRIHITGYTDRIGDEAYNMELALRRAEAVRDYLIGRGVETEFIDVTALGPHDPLVACAGKHGGRLIRCLAPNRRTVVEFSAFEVTDAAAPSGPAQPD